MTRRTLLFLVPWMAACSGAVGVDRAQGQAFAKADDGAAPTAGREWARCWLQDQTVQCQYSDDPVLPISTLVVNLDPAPPSTSPIVQGAGVAQVVASGKLSFPLHATLTLALSSQARSALAPTDSLLLESVGLEFADAAAGPVVVTQPFNFWPLQIHCVTVCAFEWIAYDLNLGDHLVQRTDSMAKPSLQVHPQMVLNAGQSGTQYLPVALGADSSSIGAHLGYVNQSGNFINGPDVDFTGPGYFIVDGEGMHAVSADDFAAASGPPAQPTTTPTTTPTTPTDPAPATTPPPPDPTCGAVGQAACGGTNGTCAAGAYCPDGDDHCVACGADGQAACGGTNGTCAAGAYCPGGDNHCVACGAAGQPACGGTNGTCNLGAYCPDGDDHCVSCDGRSC